MKRLIAFLLIFVLLLAGCQQEQPQPAPEGDPDKPQGLFVFYNPQEAMTGSALMGLVSAQGELVTSPIYDSLYIVPNFDWSETDPDLPADQRYFVANQFNRSYLMEEESLENPETAGEEQVLEPEDYDNPYLWMDRQALISPTGQELTGFDYYNILRAPGETAGFVAQKAQKPWDYVWLDSQGNESALEDPDLALICQDRNRGYAVAYTQPPSGPDVPDQQPVSLLTLADGSFWAGYNKVLPSGQEPQGKGDYLPIYRYYSADGTLQNDYEYTNIEVVSSNRLIATIEHIDEENGYYASEVYVTDITGAPLTRSYQSISGWGLQPYLLAHDKDVADLLEPESLEAVISLAMEPDQYANAQRFGKDIYITRSAPVMDADSATWKIPEVYMVGREEVITFPDYPGYNVDGCYRDGTRFVLSFYGGKGGPELESAIVLVDEQGNQLASGFQSLYAQNGILVSYEYSETEDKTRLLDWNGNVILGEEYSRIEVLPGNAALAVKGDTVGLVDLEGNWLYQQSVFTGMEA